VTVGESLTQARHEAGLSIDELSERTRIRETVIRSIEHDEYEACGGDIYVRGYVRAIAGAVGIDAQPLIREYDQVRDVPAAPKAGPDLAATRFDLTPFPGDPAVTRLDLTPVTDGPPAAEDLMAAGYELLPAGSAEPAPPAPPGRGRRGLLTAAAALLALVLIGIVGVRLASSPGPASANAAATSVPLTVTPSAARASVPAAARPAPAASPARTAPHAARTARSRPVRRRPAARRVSTLRVAAAEAFGPGGLADGDNPGIAGYAIAAGATLPWSTQWYATPEFGMLKHGTGLLLDLGRRAAVTRVRFDLTGYRGANLQLRAGDSPAPSDLRVAATADGTGGTVRLTLRHPVSARYLLIWFTLLPPNGAGQYQESVSHVVVSGRPS
jgi:hypothetical protein